MDIVYLIRCAGCNKEYIGETSNLRPRVRVHIQQTLDPRLRHLCVNHHIAHRTTGKPTLFQITPFFSINRDDKKYREIRSHMSNEAANQMQSNGACLRSIEQRRQNLLRF